MGDQARQHGNVKEDHANEPVPLPRSPHRSTMEWFIICSPIVWLFFGPAIVNGLSAVLSIGGTASSMTGLAGIPLAFLWAHYEYRKLKRQVIAHHGHLCPRCRYNLDPTPHLDRCPECGTINNRVAMRRLWREHLHLNRTDLPDPPADP